MTKTRNELLYDALHALLRNENHFRLIASYDPAALYQMFEVARFDPATLEHPEMDAEDAEGILAGWAENTARVLRRWLGSHSAREVSRRDPQLRHQIRVATECERFDEPTMTDLRQRRERLKTAWMQYSLALKDAAPKRSHAARCEFVCSPNLPAMPFKQGEQPERCWCGGENVPMPSRKPHEKLPGDEPLLGS